MQLGEPIALRGWRHLDGLAGSWKIAQLLFAFSSVRCGALSLGGGSLFLYVYIMVPLVPKGNWGEGGLSVCVSLSLVVFHLRCYVFPECPATPG